MSWTTRAVIQFSSAFPLPGFNETQPAGEYLVHHDEELIEGTSHNAWLRVRTFIHLPAIDGPSTVEQMVPITPANLEALIEKDRRQG